MDLILAAGWKAAIMPFKREVIWQIYIIHSFSLRFVKSYTKYTASKSYVMRLDAIERNIERYLQFKLF